MVLRLSLILCLFFSGLSYAAPLRISKSEKRLFETAKAAYKRGNYEDALEVLTRAFNLNDGRTPSGALFLAGYSFEKLGRWKEAEKMYTSLILNHYKAKNHAIIAAYKSGDYEGDEDIPEKLLEAYHRRAEALAQIILADDRPLRPNLYELLKKTSFMYVAILEESDYEDDSYETITERIEKREQHLKAVKYRTSWFVQSSYVSWRDEVKLIRSSGGEYTLKSTGEGTCLGGGWRYENDYWETNISGCYALTNQTIGNDDPNDPFTYFQKDVSSSALFFGPSFLWKPASKQASIGLHIPFVIRQAEYEAAEGDIIEDADIFTYGLLLQADWRFEKWGITTKFGKVQRFSSSIWSLGALYTF
ncbi:MAG: CDC27 family protein [Bdellovibrionota bacterium]|nr:CDC27 family protein [Bdellovibrionota bacterium]